MKSRIMYIEVKEDGVTGPARIGRVTFSQSERSVYYRGRRFQKTKSGFKANYFDAETGQEYWISGCKKSGGDRLYCGTVEIDEDVREEYFGTCRRKEIKPLFAERGNTPAEAPMRSSFSRTAADKQSFRLGRNAWILRCAQDDTSFV